MNTKPKARVLVVDDLPDWRITFQGLLTDEGYQVQTAGSTQEALNLLEASSFDLAVLDMRLDETDENNTEGLGLAREISRRWPDVRIIVIVGYVELETVKEAMEPQDAAGGRWLAYGFVRKTNTEELINAVEAALSA